MAFSRVNLTFYLFYLEGSDLQFTGFEERGTKEFPVRVYCGLIEISTHSFSPRHANLWVSNVTPSPPHVERNETFHIQCP